MQINELKKKQYDTLILSNILILVLVSDILLFDFLF